MVSKWVITYLQMGYIRGVVAHLLTFDPNFLGHPSTTHLPPQKKHKSLFSTAHRPRVFSGSYPTISRLPFFVSQICEKNISGSRYVLRKGLPDYPYIPILLGWDWNPQSYSIGKVLDP